MSVTVIDHKTELIRTNMKPHPIADYFNEFLMLSHVIYIILFRLQ